MKYNGGVVRDSPRVADLVLKSLDRMRKQDAQSVLILKNDLYISLRGGRPTFFLKKKLS